MAERLSARAQVQAKREAKLLAQADPFAVPRRVLADVVDFWLRPSDRDKQRKIGPSGIGDPCDYCVAVNMSLMIPGYDNPMFRRAHLAARIGTAVHLDMEQSIVGTPWDNLGLSNEMPKVLCGSIEGYGEIRGTIDQYFENIGLVNDFKTSTKAYIRKYKAKGIPQAYKYQRHTYGRGIQLLGKPIEYVANIFIPRDSDNPNDIWIDIDRYDEEHALDAFARAETIWRDFCLTGKQEELAQDPDCFNCKAYTANNVTELRFR